MITFPVGIYIWKLDGTGQTEFDTNLIKFKNFPRNGIRKIKCARTKINYSHRLL